MVEKLAISFSNVKKEYNLYTSHLQQFIDLVGLKNFFLKSKEIRHFTALDGISLSIAKGQKLGIIGKNGSGKTTLLKLITQNFQPTNGSVVVNGQVQAILNVGLGFHPDFTGRENVSASLEFNGLDGQSVESAVNDIIDFCELGEFFDQPFKSYSMGMQARLMFACATAVKPEILIIDEVLGAGDAYFIAKSSNRMNELIDDGCTMLLVSHSMQQVLEMCDTVIWLHEGKIKMQGEAFTVVKSYEDFMNNRVKQLPKINDARSFKSKSSKDTENIQKALKQGVEKKNSQSSSPFINKAFQEPYFLANDEKIEFRSKKSDLSSFKFLAKGGLSKWEKEKESELEIIGFSIFDEKKETNYFKSLTAVKFSWKILAHENGFFNCRHVLNISTLKGDLVCKLRSSKDSFSIKKGSERLIEMVLNPVQLGSGTYIIGLGLFDFEPIEVLNQTKRYDLISRSFEFVIENPSSWANQECSFFHTAEWNFE